MAIFRKSGALAVAIVDDAGALSGTSVAPLQVGGLSDPVSNAATITPSDTLDLTTPTRGLYIGGAGNVTLDLVDGGTNVLFTALQVGVIHPLRVKRVRLTGTSATGIVGVW